MSFEATSNPVICAQQVGKAYELYSKPQDRLKQLLWGRFYKKPLFKVHWALRNVSFDIHKGEVLGIVGRNGAGKSTLLQLLCGTLQPSEGQLQVRGRVAALLELGAGFNPEFTGLENVYLNAAILGMSRDEISTKLEDILNFADIGEFIGQPVKTYSSGMFVRLAFAVAISVEPDILVIDEALSVGDGAFARKSFERIMQLKDQGKTIIFCSHSMYQIEALCSRALWIEQGEMRQLGQAAEVTMAYQQFLELVNTRKSSRDVSLSDMTPTTAASGTARLLSITATSQGQSGTDIALQSCQSDWHLVVRFIADPAMPAPGIAVGISDTTGKTISSAISVNDGVELQMDKAGNGQAELHFPGFALLKGTYHVTVILTTEDGIQPYDMAMHCLTLNVTQMGTSQGVVELNHKWVT